MSKKKLEMVQSACQIRVHDYERTEELFEGVPCRLDQNENYRRILQVINIDNSIIFIRES